MIAVGDELLMGMTLDTNSHYIAQSLAEAGLRLQRLIWVSDSEEAIVAALKESWERSDVIIVTGGLGPTHDDLTRPAIAAFFKDNLVVREDLRQDILKRFESRGLKPAPGWETMAEFPTGATAIPNERGAAPGIHYSRDGRELFAVPGVPSEMKGMTQQFIIQKLSAQRTGAYQFRVIKTIGVGESHLAQLIGDPTRLLPTTLAFLPSVDNGVTLRLSIYAEAGSEEEKSLNRSEAIVCRAVQRYIYATKETSLEAVIVEILRSKGLRLALAESCTGGMITSRIVNVPGSSDVLDRGLVTYSDRSKTELLGVDTGLIVEYGAVSEDVARAMAEGVRKRAGVDIGISVTGIAGPGGASDTKPVGLTYIGLSDQSGCVVNKYLFAGNRQENRRRSTLAALTLLHGYLVK